MGKFAIARKMKGHYQTSCDHNSANINHKTIGWEGYTLC